MARVGVVGVGAIGGVLAGLLEAAGRHEIALCTRRPVEGLTVETPEGVVRVRARNLIAEEMAEAERMDWVVVATKSYDAAGAGAWFPRLCGERTRVAVVQNGVEHRENFAAHGGEALGERLVPVVIDVPAERRSDGSVLQRAGAVMRVEEGAAGREFAELFRGTTAEMELTDDFRSAAWRKLCLNAAGVISALVMKPSGVLRDEALGRVALDLVAECVAVGRAEGAKLEDGMGERVLAATRAGSPESVNSLLADRRAGRQTEIDARNGVIVRLGAKHGIATPANLMAMALMKAL